MDEVVEEVKERKKAADERSRREVTGACGGRGAQKEKTYQSPVQTASSIQWVL